MRSNVGRCATELGLPQKQLSFSFLVHHRAHISYRGMPPRTRRCSVNVLHARQTTHLRARALVKLSERRKHNRTADSPLFTAHQPPTSETLSQSLANFRGKYKMQRGPNKVLLFGAFRLCPTIPAHPAPPLVLPIRAAVAKISGATDQPALFATLCRIQSNREIC